MILAAAAQALAASLRAQQAALTAAEIAEVAETASFLCTLGDSSQSSDSGQSEASFLSSPEGVAEEGVVFSPREEQLPRWIIPESPPGPPSSPVTVPASVTVTGRTIPERTVGISRGFTYHFKGPGEGGSQSYYTK